MTFLIAWNVIKSPMVWVRFQGHFFVLRRVECNFLVKQEVKNNLLVSNTPKGNQARCNWGRYGRFPVFCWWRANTSSRSVGAPMTCEWRFHSNLSTVNIATLIILNAYGVAGAHMQIFTDGFRYISKGHEYPEYVL
jgi:hypothetical protein